ncbi:MAG: hypothetical protein WDA00_06160 [Eubacteriales bacterium]
MKCISCGHEWETTGATVTVCPSCGLHSESLPEESGYTQAVAKEQQKAYAEAARLYIQAAEADTPCAAYAAYRCYIATGEEAAGEDAAFWLRTAAEQADPLACYRLAQQYRKTDAVRHLFWLKKAADHQHERAVREMVRHYRRRGQRAYARWYFEALPRERRWRAELRLSLGRHTPAQTPPTLYLPDERSERYELGHWAQERGYLQTAYRYFDSIPDDPLFLYHKAMVGMQINVDKMVVLGYLKAAAETLSEPKFALGRLYHEGTYLPKDEEQALRYYRQAAEEGSAQAQRQLADCLSEGVLCPLNVGMARHYYRRAAQGGDEYAARRQAEIEAETERLFAAAQQALADGEMNQAIKLYIECTDRGHTEALYQLGLCLLEGKGCPRSYAQAAGCFARAAREGHAAATYALGVLYEQNRGVRFSYETALALFMRAEELGVKQAAGALARLKQRRQQKVTQHIYSLSCTLYHKGNRKEALKLLALAAKMGHPRAMYFIACRAEFGDGMPENKEMARTWYARAAALGFNGKDGKVKGGFLRQRRLLEKRGH